MPRKFRTPESLALNRENQRRSRARHRELLDDLQRRVREYESRDAQASLDMQRVARGVAAENRALRGLLAARGVALDEVEAHVAAAVAATGRDSGITATEKGNGKGNGNDSVSASAAAAPSASNRPAGLPLHPLAAAPSTFTSVSVPSPGSHDQLPLQPRQGYASPMSSGSSSCQPMTPQSIQEPRAMSPSRWPPQQQNLCSAPQRPVCASSGTSGWDNTLRAFPETSKCCAPPPPRVEAQAPPDQEAKPSNKMHCIEAASILTRLRGYPDAESARDALGCRDGNNCLVRNTDLLQLMDEAT